MAYRTTSWKNTDIGKIPSDWFFALFKDTFTKYPANSCSRDEMNNFSGVYQNIHYGDILIKYGSILDYNKYQIPFLNVDIFKKSKLLQNGDIVIADTAEDETVGKCVELLNLPQDAKILSGMHTIFCRPNNKFAPRFLGYLMNSSIYHDQLVQYITGTKVSAISKTDIDKTYILIPRIEEQQKIAAVLTDLDDLIAELEKVRDKKQAIKIGAMQELLIPKPNWIYVSLKETMNFYNGYSFKSSTYNDTGKFKVITIANVQQGKMLFERVNRVSSLPVDIQPYQRLQRGDIILSMTGNVGRTCLVNADNCLLNQRVGKIEPKDNIDKHFLYVILQNDKFISNMIDASQGGAQPNLSLSDIQKYSFYMPTDKSEQSAIAEVLSDMDDEISAINDKINKYKQIKAGVADELLSGRIRLIKPQE